MQALAALVANAYGKPVLVLTSTLKFTDKVALDSIGFNESGPMRNKPPAAIEADKEGAAGRPKSAPYVARRGPAGALEAHCAEVTRTLPRAPVPTE